MDEPKPKVKRKPGRPRVAVKVKRIMIALDEASKARAVELGAGNISRGIRIALQRS